MRRPLMTQAEEAAWLDREVSRMATAEQADLMMTPDERADLEAWEEGLDLEDLGLPLTLGAW